MLEAPEQLIEGVAQFLEFVIGAIEIEALVEVRRRDFMSCCRDRPQRLENAAGRPPTDSQREDRQDGEGKRGVQQELMQIGRVLTKREVVELPHHLLTRVADLVDIGEGTTELGSLN